MKIVKKSISLTEHEMQFAEKQSQKLAKERGGSPNLSAYIREILVREKNRLAQPLKEAA